MGTGGNVPLVLIPAGGHVGICNGGAGKSAGSVAFSTTVSPTLKAHPCGLQAPVACIPYKFAFGQVAYDSYEQMEQAVTLKASGGNYGGGTEMVVLEPLGADFYNQIVTGG